MQRTPRCFSGGFIWLRCGRVRERIMVTEKPIALSHLFIAESFQLISRRHTLPAIRCCCIHCWTLPSYSGVLMFRRYQPGGYFPLLPFNVGTCLFIEISIASCME